MVRRNNLFNLDDFLCETEKPRTGVIMDLSTLQSKANVFSENYFLTKLHHWSFWQ